MKIRGFPNLLAKMPQRQAENQIFMDEKAGNWNAVALPAIAKPPGM
ncbi:hypothetical protein [Ensifer aridi]|nr:hypothetical protein [Ensifer aridi]